MDTDRSLISFGALCALRKRGRRSLRSGPSRAVALAAIPATFRAEQGRLILDMRHLRGLHARFADSPQRHALVEFSEAKRLCIGHLMRLAQDDFHATLADALELGELRDRLRMHRLLVPRETPPRFDPPA